LNFKTTRSHRASDSSLWTSFPQTCQQRDKDVLTEPEQLVSNGVINTFENRQQQPHAFCSVPAILPIKFMKNTWNDNCSSSEQAKLHREFA
jgi:hypothetical protein